MSGRLALPSCRSRAVRLVAWALPVAVSATPGDALAAGSPDDRPATAASEECRLGSAEPYLGALREPLIPDGCERAPVPIRRALYLPSFHRMCCVTVRIEKDRAEVSFSWMAPPRGPPPANPSERIRAGEARRASAAVPVDRVKAILDRIEATQPHGLDKARRLGLDGISLLGQVCGPERALHAFSAWSPEEEAPRHRAYFRGLVDVAMEGIQDPEAVAVLESVLGYLSSDLPVRDLGGSPHVVRFYGFITGVMRPALESFLTRLPAGEPAVVDMSGTMFFPVFAGFDGRPAKTAWVATGGRLEYLQRMGIDRSHLVSTVEEGRKMVSPP